MTKGLINGLISFYDDDENHQRRKKEDISKLVDIELGSFGLVYNVENIDYEKNRLNNYLKRVLERDRMILIEDENKVLGFLHSRSYKDR